MEYRLLRRSKSNKREKWEMTARGSAEYISTLIRLNLKSAELQEFEWLVTPVD